jgi:hypothetical protein
VSGHVTEECADGGKDRGHYGNPTRERIVAVLRAVLDFVIVRAVNLELF